MTYNLNPTKELTNWQKKIITKRTKKNFFKELDKMSNDKKRYIKVFNKQLEVLVKNFDNQGLMFYSLDIELPHYKKNIWRHVHTDVEEFLNYIGCHIELIEFCYIAIQARDPVWLKKKVENKYLKKKIFPFLKCVIAVRTITGSNANLIYELQELFLLQYFPTKVTWLQNRVSILKYWKSIIRHYNFKFHRFVNYSEYYAGVYGGIADEELKFEDRSAFGQENHFISETMGVVGIRKKNPSKKEIILYLLNLYFFFKNYKINNNEVFSKIKNSKYSWEKVFSLNELRQNFFKIFEELKFAYSQQLWDFNIVDIVLTDLDFVFSKISKNNTLLLCIDSFEDVIEFTDGIYFVEKKEFLTFDLVTQEVITKYYFDCSSQISALSFFCKIEREKVITLLEK